MILAIDVGNTNIVMGFIEGDTIVDKYRLSTSSNETAEEYAIKLHSVLDLMHLEPSALEGAVLATVVPPLARTISKAVVLVTGKAPILVGPGVKTGLNIKTDNPGELGADMVVGAVAAIAKYPAPIILFDLGTATTASVIDKNGSFIGGAILCGVKTALSALATGTAQLPQIDMELPAKRFLGTNTTDCLHSGIVNGSALMLDGLFARCRATLHAPDAPVIATGTLPASIRDACATPIEYNGTLILDGLYSIWKRNVKK
jgi:type III pantothenate kinase